MFNIGGAIVLTIAPLLPTVVSAQSESAGVNQYFTNCASS